MMKKLVGVLLLSVIAGCADYQEPQANCFSFASRGFASQDCSFDALGGPDPLDLADIADE